jgi:hypothetical protein
MPLIIVNQQSSNNQQEEISVETIDRPLKERGSIRGRNSNDPVLIVNGKEKKIGKKSQYLLDMLIIE